MKVRIVCLFFFLAFLPLIAISQSKYFTREGHVNFKSDAKSELIEANNYKVTSVVDFETGIVEVAILMKAFEFEKALMEQHFNENYVESNVFPKSTLIGKIIAYEDINIQADGVYEFEVEGEFSLHGVSKSIVIPTILVVDKGMLTGNSTFSIKLEDYNIKIPRVVINNIAEVIEITVDFEYKVLER